MTAPIVNNDDRLEWPQALLDPNFPEGIHQWGEVKGDGITAGQLWERVAEGKRNNSLYSVKLVEAILNAKYRIRARNAGDAIGVQLHPVTYGLTSIDDE